MICEISGRFGMYASVNWNLSLSELHRTVEEQVDQLLYRHHDSCLFNLCCEALQHKTPVSSLDYRWHNSHVCVVDTDGQANTVPSLCVWHPSTPLWNDLHDPFNQICHCFLNCGLVCIRTSMWIGQTWMFQPHVFYFSAINFNFFTHLLTSFHTLSHTRQQLTYVQLFW